MQVMETEAGREALRKELANMQRKMAEYEDEVRLREKDLTMALEDSRRGERKLDDIRRSLEGQMEASRRDYNDLKLKVRLYISL